MTETNEQIFEKFAKRELDKEQYFDFIDAGYKDFVLKLMDEARTSTKNELNKRALGYALRALKGLWLDPADGTYAIGYLEELIRGV